jgi:hypothetical protein
MSLGVKLTIVSWLTLILGIWGFPFSTRWPGLCLLLFSFFWDSDAQSEGSIFLFWFYSAAISALMLLGSYFLSIAGTLSLSKKKSLEPHKMIIATALTVIGFGPLVPLGLIFIPAQSE